MNAPINDDGIAILEEFEQFVGHAYPDPYSPLGKELRKRGLWRKYLKAPFPLDGGLDQLSGAPWTMGLGFTKGVREGDTMTRAQCRKRLVEELSEYVEGVRDACKIAPTPNQLAAMTCLAWNIGLGWRGEKKPKGAKDGFRQSSVLRAHNRGDTMAAGRAFGLWNKAGGEESVGLTRRRAAESALYLKADDDDVPAMPQAVEGESGMTSSPINRAATITAGTATAATVAESVQTVADIKSGVDDLGSWALPILLVVAVGACAYIVWQRWKQRDGGWA